MSRVSYSLGVFGDARLEKGGPAFGRDGASAQRLPSPPGAGSPARDCRLLSVFVERTGQRGAPDRGVGGADLVDVRGPPRVGDPGYVGGEVPDAGADPSGSGASRPWQLPRVVAARHVGAGR